MFRSNESPDKIYSSSKLWNMIASMLVAFQSVVILIIITHTIGSIEAGIYTIGNTYANLFLTIGKYGMRDFHVSDVKKEFSFDTYRRSRILTCLIMVISFIAAVAIAAINNGYSSHKTWVLFFMCLYKLPDAFEDVYYGEYQRRGRLDVASKALALRLFIAICSFIILVVVFKDLLLATVITTCTTIIIMIVLIRITGKYIFKTTQSEKTINNDTSVINNKKTPSEKGIFWKTALGLLVKTAPLAIVSFLSIYISSSPRTAIDKYMSDAEQAIYGFISMPVFVVQLLVTFIFNPKVYKISCMWNEKKIKDFTSEFVKATIKIIGITLVCMLGAYLVGIPLLSWLYKADLDAYRTDLVIMMIGSGILSFVWLMTILLIIMRRQKMILGAYTLVAACAFIFSKPVVRKEGIHGAVLLYPALLIVLSILFLAVFIMGLSSEKKHQSR